MTAESIPTDFGWLTELFSEGGIDAFWLDLDGDLVPDVQVSSYQSSGDDPFSYEEYQEFDSTSEYSEWTSFDVEADGVPVFDLMEYLPVQPELAMDWSSADSAFYDPFYAPYDLPYSQEAMAPQQLEAFTDSSQQMEAFTDPNQQMEAFTDPNQQLQSMLAEQQADLMAISNETLGPFSPYADGGAFATDYSAYNLDQGFTSYSAYPSYTAPSGYDTSFSTYDASSTSSFDPTASSWMDASNSYFTDYTFDNQLEAASDTNSFWMNEYSQASDLSNQFWQMSADAANAGNSSLAYDYNQMSLDASSYADSSWSYADSGYDAMSSADDGWYSAMSGDW